MLESGNILHTVNTSCYPTLQHHNGYNRQSGNILHTVHTSCHPTLQHHNGYNRTDNYMQWNAVGSPDDGHKDARNMLRYYWLPINHYLLHLVCLTFTYLSKMHGHLNIKYKVILQADWVLLFIVWSLQSFASQVWVCQLCVYVYLATALWVSK